MLINRQLKHLCHRWHLLLLLLALCLLSLTQLFHVAIFFKLHLSWDKIKKLDVSDGIDQHDLKANNDTFSSKSTEKMKLRVAMIDKDDPNNSSNVTIPFIHNVSTNGPAPNERMLVDTNVENILTNDTSLNTSEICNGSLEIMDKFHQTLVNDTDLFESNDTDLETLLKMRVLQDTNMTLANDTMCPIIPANLTGPIHVNLQYPSYVTLRSLYPDVALGGHWRPKDCHARHKVAIIVPCRDRDSHLRAFLHNMHKLLQKQQLEYKIYVVEEIPNQTFNRGKLMNVGFVEAMKEFDWQCFIFHDVDLLPEDDRNLYTCPIGGPRHMSVAVDTFNYTRPYEGIFGGVTALTTRMLRKVNGFSNNYWGWGAEDDDMARRMSINGYKIDRYSSKVARYQMMKHVGHKMNPVNPCRLILYQCVRMRWRKDGLNSLTYRLISVKRNYIFTKIIVDLLENESRQKLTKEVRCP